MTLLQIFPVMILWLVVAIRVLGLFFGWKPGVLWAVIAVALGATLNIDQLYLALDPVLGGWNLLNLIVHLLMGVGMTELSRLLLQATGRPSGQIKFLIGVGIVLAVVQVVLLVASDTEGSAASFTDAFGAMPTISLYQATFFAWFGIIAGYTGVKTLRRNRRGESTRFRIGFDVLSAGCLAGVMAAAVKLFLVGLELLGRDEGYQGVMNGVYHVFIAFMIIGFAVGFLLPSYGRIKNAIAARKEQAEALEALKPIVERLVQTPAGERTLKATDIPPGARMSKTPLYRWFIFIGDVRLLEPDLLSAQETAIIDEIGRELERNRSTAPKSTARV